MNSHTDCLTKLHDDLLSPILSRLPTKEAVRTCVLSKGWKHRWKIINSVDTDVQCWRRHNNYNVHSFAKFLDAMLISRVHLKIFRATFQRSMGDDHVPRWINAVLRHNLEYLDVNLSNNSVFFDLYNITSMRDLKVAHTQSNSIACVAVAEKTCAPYLTSLSLHNLEISHKEQELSSFSFYFPILEVLELRKISFYYARVKSVEINAPSLVSFIIEPPLERFAEYEYSIKIVAPKLTRLLCFDDLPVNLIFDGSSVVFVLLSIEDNIDTDNEASELARDYDIEASEEARDLLNRLPNLEELALSSYMAEVLMNGPPLIHLGKLKRLTLLFGCNTDQLFQLLHAIPTLNFFSVNLDEWEDYNYEMMETIPWCFASNLEEIVLQVFSGEVPQYNLAMFLLKTTKNLKKLTITTNNIGAFKEIEQVLRTFSCCSPSLAICFRLPDAEPA